MKYAQIANQVACTWDDAGDDGERASYARAYLKICEKHLRRRHLKLSKAHDPEFWLYNKTAFFVAMAYAAAYSCATQFTDHELSLVEDAEETATKWLVIDGASAHDVKRWRDIAWAYQQDNSEALALLLKERRQSRKLY